MLSRKLIFSIVFVFGIFILYPTYGQDNSITGTPMSSFSYDQLYDKFENFDLFELSAEKVNHILNSETDDHQFSLDLGPYHWDFDIYPHDMRGSGYKSLTETKGQLVELPRIANITYRGGLKNVPGSDVTISITNTMILGQIRTPKAEYFIENLYHIIEDAPKNVFIVYETSSVLPNPALGCGMDEVHRTLSEQDHKHREEAPESACYEVIIALANTVAYTNKYGGTGGAQGKMLGILNLVQTNYDNEFRDEIMFVLGPMFSAVGTNPSSWNLSSINALLQTFGNWANGGGFGSSAYDVSTCWFNTNFGGVIGLAWVNALCGGNKYNVCRDFSSNSSGLRVLQAHELGHNFGFTHDASGAPYIMAPAVNGSNIWSNQSKAQFNANVPFSCMGPCAGAPPPVADFIATPTEGCRPMIVNFTDISLNSPTSWDWTFVGGSPATSTMRNPVVTYNIPGIYEVILEVSSPTGFSTEIKSSYIKVGDKPIADFDAIVMMDEVIFNDNSVYYGVAQYRWEFGDGNVSNDPNPTHIYEMDGIYIVKLTVTTLCGTSTIQKTVQVVTPPEPEFSALPTEGCVGTLVEFFNESSDNVDSWRWEFEGGSPGTSMVENPVVSYDSAGTFKVVLVVTNSRYQRRLEKTKYIVIDSNAVAGFDANATGLTVNFVNESHYGRTYQWRFGDGSSSNQENPAHTYAYDSIYEVRLIAGNYCDEDTMYQMVSVGSLPTAGFSASKTVDCVPGKVTFADESSDNTRRIIWKFEGGTPSSSTQANPVVTYNAVGEYKVTMIAVNGLGMDTLVQEKYIKIEDEPTAEFDFFRNGYDVTFNNTSTYGSVYEWKFGDGATSTEENPTHLYSGDGDYEVTLVVSNACGSDTTQLEVSISNRPNANFAVGEPVGCAPHRVQLENLSSDNSSDYEWSIPGGSPSSSTEENPEITFVNPGLYRVQLIAKNAFGNDTILKRDVIEVLDVPVAGFQHQLQGFNVEFQDDSDFGKDFLWDFGDGETSTLANPTHVYTSEGIFEVKMIVSNICGVDSLTKMISVTPRPILDFEVDQREICKGNSIRFSSKFGNDPDDFVWKFEGGDPATSTEESPTVYYENPGSYTVIIEATNGFGTSVDTLRQFIRVYDDPVSDYAYKKDGVTVDFTNESQEIGSVLWEFGDGHTSAETDPSHVYHLSGDYVVTLTITNACGTDVSKQNISVLHKNIDVHTIVIPPAPNPSNGLVNVSFSGQPSKEISVLIVGVNGQINEVYKGDFHQGSMSQILDLTRFQSGSYMIFFKTDSEVKMTKIILEK